MTWLFLAAGGFLLGSFLYCGYYATRWEPEVKPGYVVIGVGITIDAALHFWLSLISDVSNWAKGSVLLGYTVVATGLILVTLARRRAREHGNKGGQP